METLLFRLCFCYDNSYLNGTEMDSYYRRRSSASRMGCPEVPLLRLLSRSELTRFLETHCRVEGDGSWDAVAALPAVCLLCGGRQAKRLLRIYDGLSGRELYAGSVRDKIKKGVECWLPCNENPDALRALLSDNWLLGRAADLRETKPEELSAVLLEQAETGLDPNGQMVLDYGRRTFRVTLLPDLTLSIQNETTGKAVKTLPKAGKEDGAVQVKAANETFKELKSTVQTLLQAQKDRLFQMFLRGDSFPAERWRSAYIQNPVLQRIAALLVWSQDGACFTLTQTGEAADVAGQPYGMSEKPVKLAHPMEMKPEDVNAWQRYFTARGLKQLFAQVWEPVANFNAIREERYQGMEIPAYRFKGQERHGIKFGFSYDSSELEIILDDCTLEYDGWGSAVGRHDLNLQGSLKLGKFRVERRSRAANHIVGLLDKWTVYSRVANDDASVVKSLDSFTLAQVTEILNFAIENQRVNCTAALLEYKNKKFPDFDPMEIFTLE